MKNFNKVSVATLAVSFVFVTLPIFALAASPATVNLGTAGNFAVLSKTGISTTGSTGIVGDIGVSPAAASYITGFALTLPSASAFSTSALVSGKVYAPGYADPTPATLTTAVNDMQTAYTDATGRSLNAITELGAGNIGGMTLAPGLYKWSTGLTIPTDVTLSGSANDVWIFVIAQNLNVSSAAHIILAGGAKASNIFWVVAGQTTIGTTAVFNGNILDQTAIVLNTGATLNGRALAQTAVTLDSNAVTMPTSVASTPTPTPTPSTVACSQVAMLCPDGSYVSHTGPNCAFASCPTSTTAQTGAQTGVQSTSALSDTDVVALQNQLNGLLATAQSLQAQVQARQQTAQQGSAGASTFGQQVRAIAINLGQGSKDNNVTTLQQFLISQNKGPSAQALAKVGATSYFGALTRKALAEFQASSGISPALGNFGAITRSYLSTH
jgi:hypothetical protein